MWLYQVYTLSKIADYHSAVTLFFIKNERLRPAFPTWEMHDHRKKSSLFYIVIFLSLQAPIIMLFVSFWHWRGKDYLYLSSRKISSVYHIGGSITENIIVKSTFVAIFIFDFLFGFIYITKIGYCYSNYKKNMTRAVRSGTGSQ